MHFSMEKVLLVGRALTYIPLQGGFPRVTIIAGREMLVVLQYDRIFKLKLSS